MRIFHSDRIQIGRLLALVGLYSLGAWVVFVGWKHFWFICDDAFIAFRYASNLMHGRGLVWNPLPFDPVEGYTSFLWTGLLSAVWYVTGRDPTETSTAVGLCFGVATFTVFSLWLWKITLPAKDFVPRVAIATLCGTGLILNATFLTWSSSGLETPLVNFLIACWAWQGFALTFREGDFQTGAWCRFVLLASLLTLTRPDGMLYLAASGTMASGAWLSFRKRRFRDLAVASLPASLVLIHVGWRYQYYGYLVPNTYYAKHIGRWSEAGIRYLASFCLEYGLWLMGPLILAAVWWRFWRMGEGLRFAALPQLGVIATLFAHASYYVINIGGDHFEYRVLSYSVPLLWLAVAWACVTLRGYRILMPLSLLASLVVSVPLGWFIDYQARKFTTRDETYNLFIPLKPHFHRAFANVMALQDRNHSWLIERSVGTRRQEHKVFVEFLNRAHQSREQGSLHRSKEDDILLATHGSVGVIGWNYPNIFIVDYFGLNDEVVAHSGLVVPRRHRLMAHDRAAPPGYVACFDPNVGLHVYERNGMRRLHRRRITTGHVAYCLEQYSELVGVNYKGRKRFEKEIEAYVASGQ